MPTFSTIALERFLEPKSSSSLKSNDIYIQPQPTPVPDSESPSPYVFNLNRKGRKVANPPIQGFEIPDEPLNVELGLGCKSSSLASSTDNLSLLSNQLDFFDAQDQDFSSDWSISSLPSRGQSEELEVHATRLTLLEEVERRKAAEEALDIIRSQWQRAGDLVLTQSGLTFPTPSNASSSVELEVKSIDGFCQEFITARFVAEAIGKGQARAEAELAAQAIIQSKDLEISRLRDRLKYYEAVNHEMCQRNQQVMEVTRRQRLKKKVEQRWLWGCIGVSITIGASVIAYTCLPPEHGSTSSDPLDASCITTSGSAN